MNVWWIVGLGAVAIIVAAVVIGRRERRELGATRPMQIDFQHFLAPVPPSSLATMFESWRWLPIAELRPTAMTVTGDVFLIDRDNRIYFLDTGFGTLERIADGNEHFRRRLNDGTDFAAALLRIDLVAELAPLDSGHVHTFLGRLITGHHRREHGVAGTSARVGIAARSRCTTDDRTILDESCDSPAVSHAYRTRTMIVEGLAAAEPIAALAG